MLHYPITAAKVYGLFDRIIVSTDDDEIADVAVAEDADVFLRPSDDGTKGTQEVARDVLLTLQGVTEACVIYPCSPMLTASDLMRGHALLKRPGTLYAMSVQTDPLADAGCFYFGMAEAFMVRAPLIAAHTVMVPMPASRCIDINTEDDWIKAEAMYREWRARHV